MAIVNQGTKEEDKEMTIREYFDSHCGGEDEIRIVECSGDSPVQFLALKRIDGRIDLIDLNCANTGSNLSESTIEELRQMALEWLNAIMSNCPAEERDEIKAEVLPQINAI